MDLAAIKKLKTTVIGKKLYFYNEIDSTNSEAKRLIKLGIGEGAVVIADTQTAGRGKPGRKWHSPKGNGLYISIIIEPFRTPQKPEVLTLLGTLAAARAISGLTRLNVEVKWPNDVMISGKKAGGVLTELCRAKKGKSAFLVGIGLNVSWRKEGPPKELRGIATTICEELGKKISRTKLAKTLLEEFESLYMLFLEKKDKVILDEWKIISETIGNFLPTNSYS